MADSDEKRLDVRDIEGPPFQPIMDALDELDDDETLVLVNGFEPEPLYEQLERRGFEHDTRRAGPSEWRLRIRHA